VTLTNGETVTRVRGTGSITAARLEITEGEASKHVWKSVTEETVEYTSATMPWKTDVCGIHFIQRSAKGKCWICEEDQ